MYRNEQNFTFVIHRVPTIEICRRGAEQYDYRHFPCETTCQVADFTLRGARTGERRDEREDVIIIIIMNTIKRYNISTAWGGQHENFPKRKNFTEHGRRYKSREPGDRRDVFLDDGWENEY